MKLKTLERWVQVIVLIYVRLLSAWTVVYLLEWHDASYVFVDDNVQVIETLSKLSRSPLAQKQNIP